MCRRLFVIGSLVALSSATATCATSPTRQVGEVVQLDQSSSDGSPNVVLILSDDMGYAQRDIGPYGASDIRTPSASARPTTRRHVARATSEMDAPRASASRSLSLRLRRLDRQGREPRGASSNGAVRDRVPRCNSAGPPLRDPRAPDCCDSPCPRRPLETIVTISIFSAHRSGSLCSWSCRPIRVLHRHRAGLQVDRVLGLVSKVRRHLRDFRVGIVRMLPVVVRALVLPLAIEARHVDARGAPAAELLVTLLRRTSRWLPASSRRSRHEWSRNTHVNTALRFESIRRRVTVE